MQAGRLKILLSFLEEEPKDPFNRYAVAMELIKGDKREALKHLEILLKSDPEYLPTYYQAGQIYFDMDQYEKAIDIYDKGMSIAVQQNNDKILQELKGARQLALDEQEDW